ncbi:MAG: BNR-repeat neuraminidase N-terminal domain-containing protein, partial [Bacteroidota bacterium]
MSTIYMTSDWCKKRVTLLFTFITIALAYSQAQTTLISPTGAGGFELGTGSFADNGWTLTTSATNNWYTGQGKTNGAYSFPSSTRCAYVSNDAGANWTYLGSTNQAVHFYRDVVFPAGETQATLSFKFQQRGDNARLMVFICDTTMTPVLGVPNSGSINVGIGGWGGTGSPTMLTNTYTLQAAGTVAYTISIPPSALGNCATSQKRRIVFTWNNSTTPTNPPAAVDEISLVSKTPVAATAGIFTLNNTAPTGGTNFNSFTDAIGWINATAYCGLSNPVTINVTAGQVFNEDVPAIRAAATAANQVTFKKSGTGANPQIVPSGNGPSIAQNPGTVDFGMCLLGARYITLDGIDIKANNANIEFGYFVGLASETQGSAYNTIKNTAITLDRSNTASKGILQSASNTSGFGTGINTASATNASGTNSNNRYYNLTISNVYTGIVLYGTSTNIPDANNRIGVSNTGEFNVIGLPSVPNDIGNGTVAGAVGINAQNQQNIAIFNNKISNVSGSSANPIEAISLGAYSSSTATWNGIGGFENEVYNNIITNIKNTSTASAGMATGIRILHDAVLGMVKVKAYNNVISKITSAYAGAAVATRGIRGIFLQSTSSAGASVIYELVNNTAIIDGSSSLNLSNAVFEAGYNGPQFVIRNNLFANKTAAQSGNASHSVLGVTTYLAGLGATGTVSNYNDFYLGNTANGYLSYVNNIPDLAAWRAFYPSPAMDVNSISSDPLLNNDDVLFPLYASPLVKACPSLSTPYDVDVLGNRRNATQSTIGAYERTGDVVAPVISDTTLLGTTDLTNRVLTGLLYITDGGSIVETTPGIAPRIYFKKSTDANVFGANSPAANGWKWVETSTNASPFSFTIDYALLQSALNVHDVIQYFFVAQDTVAVPNVAAVPANGFAGTSVSNISSAPANPKSYVIYNSPAAFVDAVVSQAITAKVITGTTNQQVIRLSVQTGPTGDSAYVTAITFNSNGPNDLANITNARVWYTGTNATFATTTKFGSDFPVVAGSGALGNFTISGAQVVPPNSTSYFWLSYDINTSATAFDSVDASVVSLMYNGGSHIPSITSAPGNRIIKTAYCVPVLSSGYTISNVTFNTLNNTSAATSVTTFYSNYPAVGAATTVVKKGLQYNLSVTISSGSTGIVAFIDYNDNGVFDANETIANTQIATSGSATILPVTIPCNAVTSSEIRMRVRAVYYTNGRTGCTTNEPGEVEDYTITIQDNGPTFVSASASQVQGTVSAGAANKVLMNIKVVVNGCGNGMISSLYANTTGTTNVADITNAKLYSTGNGKLFNPANLLATVNAPSGPFSFTGFNHPLLMAPGDTNNYWITYDMAGSLTVGNIIDVSVDSIGLLGEYKIPSANNPPANTVIANANTYISASAIHPDIARVPRLGQQNSPVMRIRIVTTNAGAPIQLSQVNLNTNGGGNDTANISGAKLFYTGNVNAFSTQTPFGNAYSPVSPVTASWAPYSIAGSQYLTADTNYFWLAYDIKPNATIGDSVDAELVSFTLNGSTQIPGTSTLTGNFKINQAYCKVSYSGLGTALSNQREELTRVIVGTLDNASTCAQTGGVDSELNIYSNYTETVNPLNIRRNEATPFSITGVSNCGATTATAATVFSIYIDLNRDGDFADAGENTYRSASAAGVLTGRTVTGSIIIPCSATLGLTRMRVIYSGGNPATASCGALGQFGETEDYTINIQDNPVAYDVTSTSQLSQVVAPGFNDVMAMRIAVKAKGCGTSSVSALYFNTSASTNANADIAPALLYTTGTANQFTNATLAGTASVSANTLSFTGLNNALQNNSVADTNYFWLVFNIRSSATAANIVDVALDSIYAAGAMRLLTPSQGNPAGNIKIANKMSYVATSVIHPDLNPVSMGT